MNLYDAAPLLFVHAALIGLFFTGFSAAALLACLVTYAMRVFALTGGFHRYFSHRTFKTSRVFQFVLAWLGASAAQLGPMWWASHHRHHHQTSDTGADIHSPRHNGFLWAHIGWILCAKYAHTDDDRVKDWMAYPELRFLERWHILAPLSLAAALYALGAWMHVRHPALGTSGGQMVLWGFFLSTVLVYHATFSINSLTHMIGRRRYATTDDSRNSLLLALLTFGEGWHNNHHRYPVSARQGFFWWEIDITFYILKALSWVGLVWDLRPPPRRVYEEAAAGSAG